MKNKTGVQEWAEHSLNIQKGCENGCRYCYARHMAVKRFETMTARQWRYPVINQQKVDKGYRKRNGVIMFPTTHDITPKNIDPYCVVLSKLLKAGNQVLIVSKPNYDCIERILKDFANYKKQIMFRFTIGSINEGVLAFWEPKAPSFLERITVLDMAYEAGFQTSVSCEPYLDDFPYSVFELYKACRPFLTDSFWIGKMRGIPQRLNLIGVTGRLMSKFVKPLLAAQSDAFVRNIYRLLNDKPFVQWKDSIGDVIE